MASLRRDVFLDVTLCLALGMKLLALGLLGWLLGNCWGGGGFCETLPHWDRWMTHRGQQRPEAQVSEEGSVNEGKVLV